MIDTRQMLVVWAMLGHFIRQDQDEESRLFNERASAILNPTYPKPNRAEIRDAACKNFKRTMHLLNRGKK